MIKQDYLIRMIQEIISLIANALLNKQRIHQKEWVEYDCLTRQILGFPTEDLSNMDVQALVDRYEEDPDRKGKIELAAVTLLKMSDEMGLNELIQKTKFRQDGIALLKYVQKEGDTFSLQRECLINLLEKNS